MSSESPVCALICNGKHCRGQARERLCAALAEQGVRVEATHCLQICHGPVVLAQIGDHWEAVSRVRGKRARANLLRAMQRQRRRPVRERLVRGSKRERALARGHAKRFA
ncbi:MAG: hypothetical protein DWI48_04215 [Chloroflexi bacterium]|nr:MAG: hypothetical protein DWI48_04215 [Chloroflexota bacterium]